MQPLVQSCQRRPEPARGGCAIGQRRHLPSEPDVVRSRDRQGRLCSVIVVGDAWPGSRAIAIAKASTANDFSNDGLALSTANLYSATQPGGSLYGLNNSNPFNPDFLQQGTGIGRVPGGIITFGGGVALYSGREVIGGLGLSCDSACADRVIAYRMRRHAVLAAIPAGGGITGP